MANASNRPVELERLIGSLVGANAKRKETWKYKSNGFRCAECSAKITRDEYRESVHCNACLDQMDKGESNG